MKSLQRILYPTDFSRASALALAKTLQLARRDGAELLVAHVLPPRRRCSAIGSCQPGPTERSP